MKFKLSEELKRCLDGGGCGDCKSWNPEIKVTCRGLLQAAYEQVKRNEGRFPCDIGDKVYADSGVFGILEYTVDCIVVDKTITFQCSSYSNPIGDCPSECLDEIEPDISDFGKIVFLTQEQAETALQALKETEGEND